MHTMARLRTVTIDDRDPFGEWDLTEAVSYTHLTLPTICSV